MIVYPLVLVPVIPCLFNFQYSGIINVIKKLGMKNSIQLHLDLNLKRLERKTTKKDLDKNLEIKKAWKVIKQNCSKVILTANGSMVEYLSCLKKIRLEYIKSLKTAKTPYTNFMQIIRANRPDYFRLKGSDKSIWETFILYSRGLSIKEFFEKLEILENIDLTKIKVN